MKKDNQEISVFNKNTNKNENFEIEKIKTTNVNILLNRVRIDKKRTLRKRILFLLLASIIISFLTAYFII